MALLVKGFSNQSIISIDDVTSTIRRVPVAHIRGLTSIVYDPSRFYQRSYANPRSINYRAAGQYDSAPVDHVLVYKFSDKNEFEHILLHEIGHHVFRRKLTSQQRKKWVTEIYANSGFVSDYAKTNANEDFAECYAFYFTFPNALKALLPKFRFISDISR